MRRAARASGSTRSISASACPTCKARSPPRASLAYKGRTIKVDLAVEEPLQLVQGGSSKVALATDSELLDLDFAGTVAGGAAPSAQGAVKLAVASIRELAAWLAEPIAFAGEGLRELRIAGELRGLARAGRVQRCDDRARRHRGDRRAARGSRGARAASQRAARRRRARPQSLSAGARAGRRGRHEAAGGRAERRLRRAQRAADRAPKKRPPRHGGWSDEPIVLPAIGGAEVEFELTVAELIYRKLELGRTVVGLTLKDNQLTAELKEFAAYGGQGSGSLRIALEDGTPVIRERFALAGLQALPFLAAAADFERIEGTLRAEVEAETRGATERELVQNLNGTGNVMFTDGAIVGINLAAMMRNVAGAFLDPEAGESRKTDFAEMGGSFTVADGVLRNDDMRLQAPALRVDGSGRVNLPKRTINYRLEPKLAQTLEGQGGAREVAGLLVPVIVKGPWDDPSIAPDLSAVARRALEDPEALKEQIEQLGDQGKAVKDALKGRNGGQDALIEGLGQALGGGKKPGDAAGDRGAAKDKPEEPVQQLLKGLLGN